MILGSAGLSLLVAGIVLALLAERYVGRVAQLECAGGILIVGGLSLIGIGLAWALNSMSFVSP
ncbi:MAG TPA: hypothetical protein VGV41_10980 [Pseudolabrys sp.]|uniref:hypothetical protein n=1 Tax=Pseudolabrys sp. TaxID=1960880 RepID=UPI002DDCC0A7|nr:hypothetical protein [Pseudolabrys sp.]HEV2629158.1 hypothetical protein [Pseudolabrys sp.]